MYCTCSNGFIAQTFPVMISFITQSNILTDFGKGTTVLVETLGKELITRGFFPDYQYEENLTWKLESLGGKPIAQAPGWFNFPFYSYPFLNPTNQYNREIVNFIDIPASKPQFSVTIRAKNFNKTFVIPIFKFPPGKPLQRLKALQVIYQGNREFDYRGIYEAI